MREALVLARRHGAPKDEARDVIAGPSGAIDETKAFYKGLVVAGKHPEYAEIEFGYFEGERRSKLSQTVAAESNPQPKKRKKNEETV